MWIRWIRIRIRIWIRNTLVQVFFLYQEQVYIFETEGLGNTTVNWMLPVIVGIRCLVVGETVNPGSSDCENVHVLFTRCKMSVHQLSPGGEHTSEEEDRYLRVRFTENFIKYRK
jgi:hypothetical protein